MNLKNHFQSNTSKFNSLTLFFTLTALFLCFISRGQEYETPEGTLKQVEGEWRLFGETGDAKVDITSIAILKKEGVQQSQIDAVTNSLNLDIAYESFSGWVYYNIPAGENYSNIVSALLDQSSILNLSLSTYCYAIGNPDDPEYQNNNQWYIDKIKANLAWDDTYGSPSVTIAVIDGGIDTHHEDLGQGNDSYSNLVSGWDFVDNDSDPRSPGNIPHGSHVAGIAGAKTNNNTGIAGIAGGNNNPGCKIMPLRAGKDNGEFEELPRIQALDYAVANGADIINMSFAGPESANLSFYSSIMDAYDAGVFLVAGSGSDGTKVERYPAGYPEVFCVGGTKQDESRLSTSNYGKEYLDVSAPGEAIKSCFPNNGYWLSNGTSMSTPMVSATAALMLSVNPCLSNQQIGDIIRESAEQTGGYTYGQIGSTAFRPPYKEVSEELGHGRLNTQDAVLKAKFSKSNTLDLFIRDKTEDMGFDWSYPSANWDWDDSPDIWLQTKQLNPNYKYQHEDLNLYYGYSNAWVYVQVHNKSCVTYNPTGNDRLAVYWTRASTNASWTAGNFTDPTYALGHEVNSAQIPTLAPGESAVIELEWDITNVGAQLGENICLLARIENISADPITNYPNYLGNDVYFNNNIAMKNLTVVNHRPKYFGGATMPPGGRLFIGEPNDQPNVYDIKFGTTPWLGVDEDLFESAEVTLQVDQSFWNVADNSPEFQMTGVEIVNDETLKILNADASIKGLSFQPNERFQVYVGFSFLTEFLSEDTTNFTFHIRQFEKEGEQRATGAVHFDVTRLPRDYFKADAGGDQDIYKGESVTMSASSINEPATYNWYQADTLYYSGGSLTDSPDTTTEYTLEVVADEDNYKDYDKVKVNVKHKWITDLYPNPASNLVTLSYDLEAGTQSAHFSIINNNGVTLLNSSLSLSATSIPIDISGLSPGIYSLQLIADGVIKESRILVIQ